MKKQTFAIVVALIFLLTIITFCGLSSTKAEADYTAMHISSPMSTVYHNSTVDIFVVVHKLVDQPYPLITRIRYSLNASDIFTYEFANFTYNGLVDLPNNKTAHEYIGKATLESLEEGNYSLRIMYGQGNNTIGSWAGSSVSFRVMYGDYEPAVLVSPTNQTYYSPNVPLVFSTNEDYVYAYYCINDGKPIFVNKKDSILNGLPEGSNNLLFFVKFKDINSDFRVSFNINSTQTDSSSNLVTNLFILIAIISIAIVLVAGTIVFKKKRVSKPSFTPTTIPSVPEFS
jgi:hypothetical protein